MEYEKNGRADLDFGDEPSLTKQAEKDSCDINKVLAKCAATGTVPCSNTQMIFGNFASGADYHQIMSITTAAQQEFNQLPVDLRTRFENSVEKYIDFVLDKKNRREAAELGLIPALKDGQSYDENGDIAVRTPAEKPGAAAPAPVAPAGPPEAK